MALSFSDQQLLNQKLVLEKEPLFRTEYWDCEHFPCGSNPAECICSSWAFLSYSYFPRDFPPPPPKYGIGFFFCSGLAIAIPSFWRLSKETGEQWIAVRCCFIDQMALNN